MKNKIKNKKLIVSEVGSWNNKIKLSKKSLKFMKKNVVFCSTPFKNKNFRVEIRKTCKICGKKLGYRQRTFCSPTCRNKNNYQKRKAYQARYQIRKRDELASKPSSDKCQCLICGKYYVQVGSHIVQKHNLTAREYREYFDLDVKKGILPAWFKKIKGDMAIENGTYKNLKAGEKFWFKKGQKGVGIYKRSKETLERLSNSNKLKRNGKKIKEKFNNKGFSDSQFHSLGRYRRSFRKAKV